MSSLETHPGNRLAWKGSLKKMADSKPAAKDFVDPRILENHRPGANAPGLFSAMYTCTKEFVSGTFAAILIGLYELGKILLSLAAICGAAVVAWYVCITLWYWLRANYIG